MLLEILKMRRKEKNVYRKNFSHISMFAVLLTLSLLGKVTLNAQMITSFTLIDAENDVEIGPVSDGQSFVLANLPSTKLNMNANTEGSIGSVVFKINGVKTQTENVSPYALAGNIGNDYRVWAPKLETYIITATAYSEAKGNGNFLDEKSISITFTDEKEEDEGAPEAPSGLSGIALGSDRIDLSWQDNSDNEEEFILQYRPFNSNSEPWLDLASLPANTTTYSDTRTDIYYERFYRVKSKNAIASSAFSESISVVNFPIPPSNIKVSNITTKSFKLTWDAAPYGNDYLIESSLQPNSNFDFFDALYFGFTSFDYGGLTPNTTYYFRMRTNLNGMPSEWSEVFSITTLPEGIPDGPEITRMVLVNADTDQDIKEIFEGDVFNLLEIGTNKLNIRAEVGNNVESVIFDYNGKSNFQTENFAVYALGGNSGTNYQPWIPDLGSNTVTATAYTENNGKGIPGQPFTRNFTVINEEEPDEVEGPEVTSLVLVNADSDQDITNINDGDIFNLAELGTANLNVRAEVEGQAESVVFDYNGLSNYQIDNSPVYALGGNTGNDYEAWNPDLGINTIKATAYGQDNGQGAAGDPILVSFTITNEIEPIQPVVTSLVLVNADSDQDIAIINQGDVFNLAEIGTTNLNVRAEVEGDAESVVFDYNGQLSYEIDNSPVYALGGISGNDYDAWNPDLGSNTIGATAFTQDNGQGLASELLTVNFTTINQEEPEETQGPKITSFILVNADSDQDIAPINEGDVFNLAEIGTSNLNVRAEVEDGTESVIFDYNGQSNFQTENLPVYALGGNSGNDYDAWNPDLGINTITATAYTKDNGQGIAGEPSTVNFSFTNDVEPEVCPWNDLATSSLSKVEAQSAKVNGKLYVLAGFLSGLKITGETEIYDPTSDTWTIGAPMPTPVTHMGAVVVGDEIWILAGFEGDHPGVATDKVQIYNTVSNQWRDGPSLPNPRGSGAAAYNDGKIHFFGGLLPDRKTDVGEHYILDIEDQSAGWISAAALPNPRNHLSAASVNGLVYAIGGQYGHDGGVQDQNFVDAYNPQTDEWTRVAGLPTARSHFEPGTMVHNNKIIIVGGRQGGIFFDNVSEYDPATNQWTERCPLPSKLLAPAAKVFGDQLIVANGGENGTCCPKNSTLAITVEPEIIDPEIDDEGTVSGELRKWHKVTVSFEGPEFSEISADNPFTDYRLNVTFKNGSKTYVVPGFYAADGDAANTSANSGKIWKVHFAPDATGTWTYEASFRKGNNVAISTSASAGSSTSFDGASGSFEIANSNKSGRDLRGKGRLQYVGEHYLQFAETGEYFLKAGSDAPENTFAYEDFDATPNKGGRRKSWQPHAQDFSLGDAGAYTWGSNQGDGAKAKGRELLGMVKYLSDQGMNVFSFLTFSLNGDDGNVYPHRQQSGNATDWSNVYHERFDVSKLAQWEKILEYADKKGMYIHFKTQETENDLRMDGGQLGIERKLYYRELIARFGHHLALNWNLGEENDIWNEINNPSQSIIKSYINYIRSVDPYDHHVVIHTYPGQQDEVYDPLLGNNSQLTGPSVQSGINNVHKDVRKWVQDSEAAGKKWVVANDEQGGANVGVAVDANYPDNQLPENRNESDNRKDVRSKVLWGTLMAGGAGVEYYYGYQTGCDDLDCQDHRTRESKWKDARIALAFFNEYLQPYLLDLKSNDGLTSATNDYVFADENERYVIYLPSGGTTNIDLGNSNEFYTIEWYDPRNGGALQMGSKDGVSASSNANIGNPPSSTSQDWVAYLTKSQGPDNELRVLVYHETNGFRHGSINDGIDMIETFGSDLNWDVVNSSSSSVFNDANLATFDVVVWLNTSGNGLLTNAEQDAFERFIASNKGYVGIHAATDTYRDKSWPWYNDLVGAIVQTGPNHTPNNTNATMDVVGTHPTVEHLGSSWNKNEEYYYWEKNGGQLYSGNVNLLEVRSTGSNSYDEARPITWYKYFGGGRSFYTALGHNSSDYKNNNEFITMIKEAIIWAADGSAVVENSIVKARSFPNEIKIFPNPASESVMIETPINENSEMYTLQVISTDGRRMLSKQINGGKSDFEVSNLPPGNYFVLVKGSDFLEQKNLIIIR